MGRPSPPKVGWLNVVCLLLRGFWLTFFFRSFWGQTVEDATFEFNKSGYSRLPTTVDFPVVVSKAIKGMTFANANGRDKWKNYFLSDPSRHIIQVS